MKLKIFKTTFALLIISLIITSCKKDEPIENENGAFIKSINLNQSPIVTYTYNANNDLTKKLLNHAGSQLETTYTYTDSKISNETTKQNENIISQYNYQYNTSNQLTQCDIVGAIQTYWTFHYNNEKIDEATQFISNEESKKINFSYTGENITETQEFYRFGGTWELQSRITFEYDNKNNPYLLLKIPFSEIPDEYADLVNANNVTRIIKYDGNNIVESDIQYSYTYNSQDYPTIVTETEDGHSVEYTLIY